MAGPSAGAWIQAWVSVRQLPALGRRCVIWLGLNLTRAGGSTVRRRNAVRALSTSDRALPQRSPGAAHSAWYEGLADIQDVDLRAWTDVCMAVRETREHLVSRLADGRGWLDQHGAVGRRSSRSSSSLAP